VHTKLTRSVLTFPDFSSLLKVNVPTRVIICVMGFGYVET
jgi:hypothetical protein